MIRQTFFTSKSCNIDYMQKEMSERIRERRSQLGLTQAKLGDSLGVSRVSITKWESGITRPDGENLHQLAIRLMCSPEWLLYGVGDVDLQDTKKPPIKSGVVRLPVISSMQAVTWLEIKKESRASDRWVDIATKVSVDAFAMKVRGESMTNPGGLPTIPDGSIVVIEPVYENIDDLYGKIALVVPRDAKEAMLRRVEWDGPRMYLIPLNPNYKMAEFEGCRIIGRVVQVIQDL